MLIEKLGIDIGGVIISKRIRNLDTAFFSHNYRETPAVDNAFPAIKRMIEEKFKEKVFLVSKCSPNVQARSVNWLSHHEFFAKTGIKPGHLMFCRERQEKAGIAQQLGLTHFIDDRLEVLGILPATVTTRLLFQPSEREVEQFKEHLPKVTVVHSWEEVLSQVLG